MAFKGSGPVLFVLRAIVLILGSCAADYQNFLRQHYNNPMSNVKGNFCETMMQSRGMTRPQYKAVNTFIHAPKKQIIDVCVKGQLINSNRLRRSRTQFTVTACKHKGGSTRPPCKYSGNKSRRYIVIACERGKPVHYDEGHI